MILSETNVEGNRCLVMDPPVIPAGAPVVVVLHGLGTNGDDLAPLCGELGLPPCRFVLPDAPLRLPGYTDGSFAWYDLQAHDRRDVEKGREYLYKVLDRFANDPNLRPGPGSGQQKRPMVLMGFSQGGLMSLETGLNYKGGLSAIVSMSGYLPDPWTTLMKAEAPFETPILLVHGVEDQVVPVQGSRQAYKAIQDAGYSPVLKEFPMGHTISEDSLAEVAGFLRKALKDPVL